jgi:hypothetical protein
VKTFAHHGRKREETTNRIKGRKPTMPDIKITLDEEQHHLLSEEYKKACIDWLRSKPGAVPPPFEQWLSRRLADNVRSAARSEREVEELRILNAIEQLVTHLQAHGFGLAHLGQHGAELPDSAEALAQALIADLGLPRVRARRMRELLEYYSRNAREIADLGLVTVTSRAYAALHEACRELIERTKIARPHLGEDKALGRVEGAVAILVSLNVMSRQAAREMADAFGFQEQR